MKDDKVLKETIFVDSWLDSIRVDFDNIDIKELFDKHHKKLSIVDNWTYSGSGWNLHLILIYHLIVAEIAPCEVSLYFLLRKELKKFNERID